MLDIRRCGIDVLVFDQRTGFGVVIFQ